MNQPLISIGEKVLIITRRLFPEDLRRHHIGEVRGLSASAIRVEGNAWVANAVGTYERRPEKRTRLISLSGFVDLVFVLPLDLDIQKLRYVATQGRLLLSDGADFSLDISEFAVR